MREHVNLFTLTIVRRLAITVALLASAVLASCGSGSTPVVNAAPTPYSAPCAQRGAVAPCVNALQLQVVYNLKPLYAKGLDGIGISVVVLADGGISSLRSELNGFDSAFHLPAPKLRIVSLDGAKETAAGSDELALDTEAVHTVAPGASIVVLVVPTTSDPSSIEPQAEAVRYAATHHLGQVITTSLGNVGEAALGPGIISGLQESFQFAADRHVSVVDASGDFGASSRQTLAGPAGPGCCFTERMRGYPASDPTVTAVGATRLHLNARGERTSPDTVANDQEGASGGGLSTVFSRPSYQNAVESVVGDYRGGPDVSMNEDIDSGFEMYANTSSGDGQADLGWSSVGGTSESAPLFAGIVAIADQAAGRPLGELNPYLYRAYQLPNHGGIVPVTSGNNTVSIESSSGTDVIVPGYHADAGYNMATGLGTVNADQLVRTLAFLARH